MSDHISGPRALADPIADITDVYAFPSPDRPGALVLVDEHASDGQARGLLLGRAAVPLPAATAHRRTAGAGWLFVAGEEELVLDCVFDPPSRDATAETAT